MKTCPSPARVDLCERACSLLASCMGDQPSDLLLAVEAVGELVDDLLEASKDRFSRKFCDRLEMEIGSIDCALQEAMLHDESERLRGVAELLRKLVKAVDKRAAK